MIYDKDGLLMSGSKDLGGWVVELGKLWPDLPIVVYTSATKTIIKGFDPTNVTQEPNAQ